MNLERSLKKIIKLVSLFAQTTNDAGEHDVTATPRTIPHPLTPPTHPTPITPLTPFPPPTGTAPSASPSTATPRASGTPLDMEEGEPKDMEKSGQEFEEEV